MQSLKAHVRNGRLVLDEPTDLPEGAEVVLTVSDDDRMEDEERARLHAALERSMAQAKAGKLVDADVVLGRLLARERKSGSRRRPKRRRKPVTTGGVRTVMRARSSRASWLRPSRC
jgi:anti-sigma factor RsiW